MDFQDSCICFIRSANCTKRSHQFHRYLVSKLYNVSILKNLHFYQWQFLQITSRLLSYSIWFSVFNGFCCTIWRLLCSALDFNRWKNEKNQTLKVSDQSIATKLESNSAYTSEAWKSHSGESLRTAFQCNKFLYSDFCRKFNILVLKLWLKIKCRVLKVKQLFF